MVFFIAINQTTMGALLQIIDRVLWFVSYLFHRGFDPFLTFVSHYISDPTIALVVAMILAILGYGVLVDVFIGVLLITGFVAFELIPNAFHRTKIEPQTVGDTTLNRQSRAKGIECETGIVIDDLGVIDGKLMVQLFEKCAQTLPQLLELIKRDPASRDIEAYLPGHAQFICARSQCTHSCCKAHGPVGNLKVRVTGEFRAAVRASRGLTDDQFVIYEGPCTVLRKDEAHSCVFLGSEHQCAVYDIRPSVCEAYPFELVFFDLAKDGRLRKISYREIYSKVNDTAPPFFRSAVLFD